MTFRKGLHSLAQFLHAFIIDDATDEDKDEVVGREAELLPLPGTEGLNGSVIDIGCRLFRAVGNGLTA